jgi:predicted PhzF superfamily epimerase YddE/YHI9
MKYNYYICDVFTDQRFGGNQLAVLADASGLNDKSTLKGPQKKATQLIKQYFRHQ